VSRTVRRRAAWIAWALVPVVALLDPWGGEECSGAPCEEGFLIWVWVAVALFVLWLLAGVWLAVTALIARRRRLPD
jgi:hypothetical protein